MQRSKVPEIFVSHHITTSLALLLSLRGRGIPSFDPQCKVDDQAHIPHQTPHWRKLPIVLQNNIHDIVRRATHYIGQAQVIQRRCWYTRGACGSYTSGIQSESLKSIDGRGVGALEAEDCLYIQTKVGEDCE